MGLFRRKGRTSEASPAESQEDQRASDPDRARPEPAGRPEDDLLGDPSDGAAASASTPSPSPPSPGPEDPESTKQHGRLMRVLNRAGDRLLPVGAMVVLLAALVVLYLWNGLIVLIRPGEAGALYRPFDGGTVTDYVFPEGLHVLKPWNHMHVYDVRVQTVRQEFRVLTNKGLPIYLSLAIRFYPEYEMVGLLHQRVGPDYVEKIVVPQVESVLRRNIGRHDPEDIYTNKEGILTDIIVKAIEEAGQKFVFIDDIIIRSVTLPEEVHAAIAEKLVEQQRWKTYEFRLAREQQEAERKRIESQGIRDYQANIQETLTPDVLRYHGVSATLELAQSPNSKMIVIGGGEGGLPVILNPGPTEPDLGPPPSTGGGADPAAAAEAAAAAAAPPTPVTPTPDTPASGTSETPPSATADPAAPASR